MASSQATRHLSQASRRVFRARGKPNKIQITPLSPIGKAFENSPPWRTGHGNRVLCLETETPNNEIQIYPPIKNVGKGPRLSSCAPPVLRSVCLCCECLCCECRSVVWVAVSVYAAVRVCALNVYVAFDGGEKSTWRVHLTEVTSTLNVYMAEPPGSAPRGPAAAAVSAEGSSPPRAGGRRRTWTGTGRKCRAPPGPGTPE